MTTKVITPATGAGRAVDRNNALSAASWAAVVEAAYLLQAVGR